MGWLHDGKKIVTWLDHGLVRQQWSGNGLLRAWSKWLDNGIFRGSQTRVRQWICKTMVRQWLDDCQSTVRKLLGNDMVR